CCKYFSEFGHHKVINLLTVSLNRQFSREGGHNRHIAMSVKQYGIPECAHCPQFIYSCSLQLLIHLILACLYLVLDAVGPVDSEEACFIYILRLPRLGSPGVLVHALVSTTVIPSVRANRGDDDISGFLLAIKQTLPVHDELKGYVSTSHQGNNIFL